MEQRSDESAEAEVRDLDARMPPTPTPADLDGGRIRPAALVRWGFFAGVGLLLAYGAAQALLSVRNLLVLVLVPATTAAATVSTLVASHASRVGATDWAAAGNSARSPAPAAKVPKT